MSKTQVTLIQRLSGFGKARDPRKRTKKILNPEKLEDRQLKTVSVFADEAQFMDSVGEVAGPIDFPLGQTGQV
ncbi:MAG: hypothetical protein KDB27_25295, partial [Planctomycetales bacterium]|nr:hypothetical protein [Planctomycetales bacterium]